jgi:hypothetical protein
MMPVLVGLVSRGDPGAEVQTISRDSISVSVGLTDACRESEHRSIDHDSSAPNPEVTTIFGSHVAYPILCFPPRVPLQTQVSSVELP